MRMDLSSRESIEECFAALEDRERISLLVNNAGQMTGGLLEEQETDEIYSMFQVNLLGLVHLSKLVLPAMVAAGAGRS